MRKLILLTSAAAVAFWGNALMGQTPNPAPAPNQTKVQKRDRVHVPDGTVAQAQKKLGKKGQNGQKTAKGKQAKQGPGDGAGNIGNRPSDGTGYGANSGNRRGPLDGSGSRNGDWQSGRRGGFGSVGAPSGSMGRGRSGGRGGRR